MVLVTGATGLVGSHLVLHLLGNNENVRAIYRSRASVEKTKSVFAHYGKSDLFHQIEWVEADICDVPSLAAAFQNVNFVYHCAASISFDPADEDEIRKINIEGTANIVNFCLEFHVKKLCFVSSIATLGSRNFGTKEHELSISEETEWNPEASHSDYAISKYGAEMEIWRGKQEGLEVAVINPGVILGPCFWHSGSGEIFSRIANGLPFYTKGITGFVTVNDVVKLLVQLMKSGINGERFITVSENISFEEALKIVAKSINAKAPSVYGKPWMTAISWRFDWILSNVFQMKRRLSKSMAHSLHSTTVFSNGRVKSALGFEFEAIEPYILKIGKDYPKK
jgi:dihydroflavonol-4-reductase